MNAEDFLKDIIKNTFEGNKLIRNDSMILDKIILITKSYNNILDPALNKDITAELLLKLKRDYKLDLINEDFLNETQWLGNNYNSYFRALYAIFYQEDYYNEDSDDYLFVITDIIMRSVDGNLSKYGKNYDNYFLEFNKILELYSLSHVFLNRDLNNKIINRREHHFFEIILATFLAYYYLDCNHLSLDKVTETIKEIFNYREFLEQWQIKGVDYSNLDNYEKEKLIAKTLINNISIRKQTIR